MYVRFCFSACYTCGRWNCAIQPHFSFSEVTTSAVISRNTSHLSRNVSKLSSRGSKLFSCIHIYNFKKYIINEHFYNLWRLQIFFFLQKFARKKARPFFLPPISKYTFLRVVGSFISLRVARFLAMAHFCFASY